MTPHEAIVVTDAKERIKSAGINWCTVTHGHDASQAGISGAIEALRIVKERIKAQRCIGHIERYQRDRNVVIIDALIQEIEAQS